MMHRALRKVIALSLKVKLVVLFGHLTGFGFLLCRGLVSFLFGHQHTLKLLLWLTLPLRL